jgi:cytochrome d ubiquinol oxidase subunit I
VLIGLPDEERQENRFAVEIPGLASLILRHSVDGEVQGLNEFPGAHPPVAPVFWAFRIMVGLGFLMLAVAWAATWQLRRQRIPPRRVLQILASMTFVGWIAMLAGWYTTEIGRQPFLVSGVLRTADAVTEIAAGKVALTLGLYLVLYTVLATAYISVVFYLVRRAALPEEKASRPAAHGPRVMNTPVAETLESGDV